MKKISRVFVANRGEIAVRVIRACKALGIESIAAVSEADRESLPANLADRAICIGPPRAQASYLNVNTLITAALGSGADAIHPGYGFLAEQPELAEACDKHGLIFIGPTGDSIRKMGNKLQARKIAEGCGVPTIPGSKKARDIKEASLMAETLGFPVLLKAAAGGGGRGMKIIKDNRDLEAVFDTLTSEVQSAFGDGTLYMEHFIPNARHIEVQILGDHFGNVVHLGERDCSIQRRYQKLIEEAPSPAVSPGLREQICKAAVNIAETINYVNAGTIEFVLDQEKGKFYFLEMNTRIQVEHPVTELITGKDLVQEQIRIAGLQPLSFNQEDVRLSGHAIECRINAESLRLDFLPSPGKIEQWIPPTGPGIRVDSHCYPGYFIPPYYDSLIAKLIVSGADRSQAIERMRFALENFTVSGVETIINFHLLVLGQPDYINGKVSTRWVEETVLPGLEKSS